MQRNLVDALDTMGRLDDSISEVASFLRAGALAARSASTLHIAGESRLCGARVTRAEALLSGGRDLLSEVINEARITVRKFQVGALQARQDDQPGTWDGMSAEWWATHAERTAERIETMATVAQTVHTGLNGMEKVSRARYAESVERAVARAGELEQAWEAVKKEGESWGEVARLVVMEGVGESGSLFPI